MHKKFQVFISSTFVDLKGARAAVSNALLRADCFPAGMELFPASDEEQFSFIKRIIDQSDYYLVISAGKYGSVHPSTGLSYTEMEYDYAVRQGKPVIRLLHSDPLGTLPNDMVEMSDAGRVKLLSFHAKLKSSRLVQFWDTPDELQIEVLFALQQAQRMFPVPGWIRGDDPTILELKEKIKSLQQELTSGTRQPDADQADRLKNFDGVLAALGKNGQDVSKVDCLLEIKSLFERSSSVFIENLTKALVSHGIPEDIIQSAIDALCLDEMLKTRKTGEVVLLPAGQIMLRQTALQQYVDS